MFQHDGSTWSEQQRLTASDPGNDDSFGLSVALDGDTLVVGAHLDDCAAGPNCGAAYVFVRSDSTWTQQQKLAAPPEDAEPGDVFGLRVDIWGDGLIVGAVEVLVRMLVSADQWLSCTCCRLGCVCVMMSTPLKNGEARRW